MKNFIVKGETILYAALGTLASGAVVAIGSGYGVIADDMVNGDTGPVYVQGVFSLTSDTGTAYVAGDRLYWDAGNSRVTKTATSNKPIGYAYAAKASATTTAKVMLVQNSAKAATVAAVATADGSDPTTTQALANQLKTSLNAVLVALKAADMMA